MYKIGLPLHVTDEPTLERAGFSWERVIDPREKIILLAKENLGKPYKYGASITNDAPRFFDCSSFTAWLYVQAGISLPRISADQYVFGKEVSSAEALPGDLVFSNTHRDIRGVLHLESKEYKAGTKLPKPIDHCGIFMGDNKICHAKGSKGMVVIENLKESDYFQDIVGFRRISDIENGHYVITIPEERADLRNSENLLKEINTHA